MKVLEAFFAAFPSCRAMVKSMAAAGNKVGVEWTRSGAPQAGLQAADRGRDSADVELISTHRAEGGKLAETWVFFHLPRFTGFG